MDTIKIEHPNTQFIAHRGLSSIERENTAAAFVAAGNRSYFGIETDVHRTADGRYILIHDDTTARVTGDVNLNVEKSSFDTLRGLTLRDMDGKKRKDLILPTPEEYFSICKKYEKTAVFELKNQFTTEQICQITELVRNTGHLDRTIFISFSYFNVQTVRRLLPSSAVQYLFSGEITMDLVEKLKKDNLGLDVRHDRLNARTMEMLKRENIPVNCWTVDDSKEAKRLIELGVDYITTNRLE
ncbi:MAG: hypothetical protein E7616_04705 [Ruminococcaceae bacterium]|nr:hypothetical protein [Oscillospiraceae bacterium]